MSRSGAYVLLEDGTRFDGEACGADAHATGEVVFTTGMSGYQESMTDPSFARQLITFTYPHIGNYGASAEAMESDRVWARAAIMRAATNTEDSPGAERGWLDWLGDCGVPAITDVDTRALVRHIRSAGAMRGGVFPERIAEREARELIAAEPPMTGLDLAREVTPGADDHARRRRHPDRRHRHGDQGLDRPQPRRARRDGRAAPVHDAGRGPRRGATPTPSSSPTAPATRPPSSYVVDTLRELIGPRPVFGICLGHQLLSRAVGLETFKLPFGHRGANHPVKDLETGRIEITSQNHGFAVLGPGGARTVDADEPVRWSTDFGEAQLSHVNLYDRTVEGLTLLDVPGGTVQYHPEAGPGPHDSLYLFDRFLDQIRSAA